ncbi:MAG: RNA-binding protein [Verrucomicrobiota bacterium]
MSNASSENQGGDGGGQRRRRSRGGRNRNRNRKSNQDGSPRNENHNREGSRDGQPRKRNRNRNRNRNRDGGGEGGGGGRSRSRRAPKPVPLTWWQKLLKAVGLYKEPTKGSRDGKPAPKSNTRVAKTTGDRPKDGGKKRDRKPKGEEQRERQVPQNVKVDSNRIYLGNLSYEATENDLEELFKGVGSVRRVEIVYNRQTHRSKGYGFIDMLNRDEAKRSIEILHDQFFMGRRLVVSAAKSEGRPDDEAETPKEEAKPEPVAAEAEQITIEEPKA